MTKDARDYLIQRGANIFELQMLVRERIAEGWTPQGGVNAVFDTAGTVKEVYQALVRDRT